MGIALKRISESERIRIAEDLFKVTSRDTKKGELYGLCPLHKEKNTSFSYNFKLDTYHCFSCGEDGDLCRLWSEVHGYDKTEGFKEFCRQFGIENTVYRPTRKNDDTGDPGKQEDEMKAEAEKENIDLPDLETIWEEFPPLPENRIQELESSRRWSRKWIETLDLRLQTHYQDKQGAIKEIKDPERIAIPVRDDTGKLVNIRIYKPGAKQFKIISWAKLYGKARLYPAKPLSDADPVLLLEGEPDTICAISHGFNAITQTSKTKQWKKEHREPFRDRDVIIAYDADQAGQKYATFAAESLLGIARSVRMLQWPDFMGKKNGEWPKDHGEDLTDFFAKHNRQPSELLDLISTAPVYESDAAERGVFRFYSRGVNDRFSFKPRLLAKQIMKDFDLLSDPKTGLMFRWNGRFWEEFDEENIKRACINYLEDEAQKSRYGDAADQVRILSTIPHGRAVNDNHEWVCLQNGIFNLMTLDLEPHTKDFYFTYSLPVSFDPDAPCDRWEEYLKETIQTPHAIAQAQEFAGYCMVRNTKYEKCLILLGPGSDGKSTFLKILKELVGEENCASVSFPDLEDQFQRSSLYGKLINISTEVGAKAIESPYFKAITSGDPINAAFKHRNAFTFSPYCKLAFAANRLPRVLDNSDGFFRRVLPIQFKRQFLNDADPDLFYKLTRELSGIFSWAIVGLHRLLEQNRFTDSLETRELMMDYRRANNPILCFVEDCCELGDEHETAKSEIYAYYRKYCSQNGFTAMNRENFFRELYVAVHNIKQYRPRTDAGRTMKLKGIGLVVPLPPAPSY
jgi:putative DNA primase/helicase